MEIAFTLIEAIAKLFRGDSGNDEIRKPPPEEGPRIRAKARKHDPENHRS